jgi:CBS domain-containing protein
MLIPRRQRERKQLEVPLFKRYGKPIDITVQTLMSSPPVVIPSTAAIEEAVGLMWDRKVGSVLVINEQGKLVGIVTERDIIFAAARSMIGKRRPVSDIMAKNLVTTSLGEGLTFALEKMRQANVRHLPVMDERGNPLGLLSVRDVLDAGMLLMRVIARSE